MGSIVYRIAKAIRRSQLLRPMKNASGYLLFSIINKAGPFLLVPVLTRYLSTSEVGRYALFQVVIVFATPFIGMGVQNYIARAYHRDSRGRLAKGVGSALSLVVGIGLIGAGVIAAVYRAIGSSLEVPEIWMYGAIAVAASTSVSGILQTILRNEGKVAQYGIQTVGQTVTSVLLSLVLLVGFGMGWESLAVAIVVSSTLWACIALSILYRREFIEWHGDWHQIKTIIHISWPFIPHSIGTGVIALSDRLFIERMVGVSALGVYSIGYQLGSSLSLITTAVNLAWSPWLYRQLQKHDSRQYDMVVKSVYGLSIVYGTCAVVWVIGGWWAMPIIVSREFLGAVSYLTWIAPATAIQGMYTLLFPIMVHTGRTGALGAITTAVAVINLVANYVFISINGGIGAAQATLICYGVLFLSVLWYSNRIMPMPWRRYLLGKRYISRHPA